LLLAACGPFLDWWNPGGKLSTPAVQATIVVVFLLVAAVIFTVHLVLAAVHEYGWSRRAAADIATSEIDELKALWPDVKAAYQAAQPALAQLPDFAAVADRVGVLEQKVQSVAVQPDTAVLAAQVKDLIVSGAVGTPPAVESPAAGV
jgi:hypothetical protein